jgi:hypothetical protein
MWSTKIKIIIFLQINHQFRVLAAKPKAKSQKLGQKFQGNLNPVKQNHNKKQYIVWHNTYVLVDSDSQKVS